MTVNKNEIKKLLKRFPHAVKITVELPSGEKLTVNKKPLTKQDIINENYAALQGIEISLTDAVQKYNVPRQTIVNWVKTGYIEVIKSGYGMTVNEAELAYCVDVYKQRKSTKIGFRGGPLLDDNGLPYQVKHPSLSKYRRKRKTGQLSKNPRAD